MVPVVAKPDSMGMPSIARTVNSDSMQLISVRHFFTPTPNRVEFRATTAGTAIIGSGKGRATTAEPARSLPVTNRFIGPTVNPSWLDPVDSVEQHHN